MLETICGHCGEKLAIPEQYAGMKGVCKKCDWEIIAPEVSPPPDEDNMCWPAADDSPDVASELTFIDAYQNAYDQALHILENVAGELVGAGQEMKALESRMNALSTVNEVHESLSFYYELFRDAQEFLEENNSERLSQLGHKLIPTFEYLKDNNPWGHDDSTLQKLSEKSYRKLGYGIKNYTSLPPLLPPYKFMETEYLLDALRILIEPNYIPGENREEDSEESGLDESRYIPSKVKVAVWRRDQGKCVDCGSKEKLEYDHILPYSKGGSNTERNIQLMCEKCNRQKGAKIE
jgi:hypothetical protein